MHVCFCNQFNDQAVEKVAPKAHGSAAAVYRELGCEPKCGKCVNHIREILETADTPAAALAFGAD